MIYYLVTPHDRNIVLDALTKLDGGERLSIYSELWLQRIFWSWMGKSDEFVRNDKSRFPVSTRHIVEALAIAFLHGRREGEAKHYAEPFTAYESGVLFGAMSRCPTCGYGAMYKTLDGWLKCAFGHLWEEVDHGRSERGSGIDGGEFEPVAGVTTVVLNGQPRLRQEVANQASGDALDCDCRESRLGAY